MPRRNKHTQEVGSRPQPLRQSYSIPDGLVKMNEPHSLHKFAQNEHFLVRQSNESFSGFSSHEASPRHACRIRSYSLSVKDPYLQVFPLAEHCFMNFYITFRSFLNSRKEPLGAFGMVLWNHLYREQIAVK